MAIEVIGALPGMEVGNGFDTVSNDVKVSRAVKGNVRTSPGATGQAGGFSLVIVRGSEEFDDALDVSASARGGIGPFSGSAKASFKQKCKVSTEALFCVLSFNATNALESFHGEPTLSEDAEELLRLGKMERFRTRFGNRFISGRYDGGEFFGSIRVESESRDQQQEIAASINASFGVFKASGSVDKETSQKLSKEKIEILTMQAGAVVVPVFTLDALFGRAQEVARQVAKGQAVPISVTLETYNELELPRDDISSMEQEHAKGVMKKLNEDYNKLLELQNDIDFVLRHQDYYKKVNVKEFNDANEQITKDLNAIADGADRCARDFSQCEFFAPTVPKIQIPERKRPSRKPAERRHRLRQKAHNLQQEARLVEELIQHLSPGPRRKRLKKKVQELRAQAKKLMAQSQKKKKKTKKKTAKKKTTKKKAAKAGKAGAGGGKKGGPVNKGRKKRG